MATNNKDFKVKHGLIVEGAQGTINNQTILTEVDGDAYILALAGGGGDSANTPGTLVKRDANGDFAAGDITVNELIIGEIGRIYDDSELLIAASAGEDIKLTADDIRMESVDDIRMTALGDILLDASEPGMGVYVGSIGTGNTVVTEAIMDSHIGDNTVDGTTGNTITDRIASASQDLTDHENATEAHGATGAVVGTTNEQTLTNKTISYTDNTLTVQVANVSDLTATASELNVLDGITATTTELNYVDGVTSGIQGQLDDKAPLDSPALTGTPTAPTAAAGTNSTQVATTAYADAAVAALVNGAPELLNTLDELALALQDNPSIIEDLQDIAAGKQDTLTAGDNIDITGVTISVVGLDAADISDFNDAALAATAAAYDMYGAAAAAQEAAEDYADGLAINYDAAGSAATAEQNAKDYADALDTDDIEEGATNEYFTDVRAKTSAAQLLTGATKTNIVITGDETGLTITAENGVADSDTDDLTEGTSNLYFTEQRAIDAIQDTTPNFTSVEINSIAKQVASTVSVATASQVTAYEFLGTEYRSAKFLVKTAQGSHTDVAEVLLTMDSSNNISITEYAMVGTNGSLMTITADYVEVGTTVRLRVTTANNTSVVTVVGTLLA
jgi:hypothetical protein